MSVADCAEGTVTSARCLFAVRDYDLAATLSSGQAFRWNRQGDTWCGIIGRRMVVLRQRPEGIEAITARPQSDWSWLTHYLQTGVDLAEVLATFPDDPPMRVAVESCRGLRLLRQDPWECLACFILSSTKQITQIRQIVAELCRRFGEPVAGVTAAQAFGPSEPRVLPEEGGFSFPPPERLARATEAELRACKAGFRAPYLLAAARRVASGECDLAGLGGRCLAESRFELERLPGVGPKIANCVLLFAYGFPMAFPVDVWILRALRQLYFPRRRPNPGRLRAFAEDHFGPHSGYAQQYLFHYMRTHHPKSK